MAEPTRWQRTREAGMTSYAEHFAEAVAAGEDVDGEARLADALLPRGGRVLDVGAGMGRVAAALQDRGHHVVAVEPDPGLVERARTTYPDLRVVETDLLDLSPADHGVPGAYDLVVCVGNVLVYLADGTERAFLSRLRGLLAPGGRVLAGFQPVAVRWGARDYPPDDFTADAASVGLRVDARFGDYELRPPQDDYAVWLLSAAEV